MGNFLKRLKEKLFTDNNIYLFGILLLSCFFFLSKLGDYRLIDIDETRYINIARTMFYNNDFITPYLNFEPFLEKPPLYYWLVVLSYKLTGTVNNFTSRLPVALLAIMGVFATYFFTFKVVKSKSIAFISSIVLMSTFWFALFSHIAILDLGFTVFSSIAFYFGVSTLFVESENKKKLLWYLGYIFLGLSVLQKGLIGVIVPSGALFFVFLAFRRVKEIFKPSHFIIGLIFFLLVAAPWHYLVYQANGDVWFNEYIVKHHFARFIDSDFVNVGREQPFLFFLPILLGGFLPWTLFLIAAFIRGGKYAISTYKSTKSIKPLLSHDTPERDLILISFIWFLFVFVFFSFSNTKLPTYILPAFPPLAILTGYFIRGYIYEIKSKKYFEISALITFTLFLIAGIVGVILRLSEFVTIGMPLAVSFIIFSLTGFIFFMLKQRLWVFASVVAFSLTLFACSSAEIFNYVTDFGQEELEDFARIAKENNAKALIAFGFSRKYSMSNIYDKKPIYFIPNYDGEKYILFEKTIDEVSKDKNGDIYVITRIKNQEPKTFIHKLTAVKTGQKYNLFKLK